MHEDNIVTKSCTL